MTILDRIVSAKFEEVAFRKGQRTRAEVREAMMMQSPTRGFHKSLLAVQGHAVIAEIKRASPSSSSIREHDWDPAAHARDYQSGGAACLSVLTDERFFSGADQFLVDARLAVDLPVLRKDFIVDEWQVHEARALGADAILLIAAILSDATLEACEAIALDCGMDVLIEVHDEYELERATRLRSKLIGCNNRNLKDFSIDITLSARLKSLAPECTLVAESGLQSRGDLDDLAERGVHAFLIGEALMRQRDLVAATRALTE